MKDVLQGKVVTSIGDDSYIFGFFENYKNEGIQLVVDPYHEKKHYAIVIKKGNTELKNLQFYEGPLESSSNFLCTFSKK